MTTSPALRRTARPAARAVLTAAALLCAGVPARLAAQMPASPPAPMPLRPVRFPPFVTGILPNGAQYLVVTNHRQPAVTISLSVPAGGFYVPADKTGLDDLVATLLTKGTSQRTADQIAQEIESAGGSIGASAGPDYITITVSTLAEGFPRALDLLADVVAHSTFPASEVDLARTQALSALQLDLSEPASLASRAFLHEIYGAHPYGRSATATTVQGLTRDDVLAYYSARVRPVGSLLVVAGDVDPIQVRRLAATAFAGWRGTPAAAPAAPPVPARTSREILLVNKPGAVQSNIVAGLPFITPRDPAIYPLTLMNRILGDGADSRLFLILREQHGWTYGSYSGFTEPRGVGAFEATAEVRTPVTDSALGELVRQLDRIRAQTPPDSEIAAAKDYITGSFPLSIETPDQIAGAVAQARLRGQPDDFVARYRERVAAVTPAQMMAATRRALDVSHLAIVVVGDGAKILAGLKALSLGPVRIVDTDGHPMTEAELAPSAASAVAWRTANLRSGTSHYRILVQGNPFGEETRTIAHDTAGGRDAITAITSTQIGPIVQINDTTTFDAVTYAPIRERETGTIQNQPTFIRVDYADGRVRGSAHSVTPGQPPRDVAIDTALAAGTLDQDQLQAVIVALPLAAGGQWTIPMFQGDEGQSRTASIRVAGEDSVTVPAGTFAAWKVEVSGMDQTMNLYVAKGDDPVLVKLEIVGAPLAFELTGRN